jgi:hypothetical protein
MHLDDSSRTPAPFQPGTTRRTWVRAAANVAWAVPLVSVATAAPAHAATSTASGGSLTLVLAEFYIWRWNNNYCVDPLITVTNNTARDAVAQVRVTLQFSVADFVGFWQNTVPPTPAYLNVPMMSPDLSWLPETGGVSPKDTFVSVYLLRSVGLARGETSTVGGGSPKSLFGIVFTQPPKVAKVPLLLQEDSGTFLVTAGSMKQTNQLP